MKTISIKLSDDLDAKLNAAVQRRKTSKSRLLRQILEDHLERSRPRGGSVLDLAGDLVGSIDRGSADLATHPKHLRGFGK